MSKIIEFAKRFASAGFYVFPLYSSSKGPMKPYGWALNNVKEDVDKNKIIPATNDPDVVDQWPQIVSDAYDADVVSFGVLGKGFVIIDIDIKNSKRGDISYDLLRKSYKIPAAVLKVKSKSGGIHLYFAKSNRFSKTPIKSVSDVIVGGIKYSGVDIRGDGGMVIGPTAEGEWEQGVYTLIDGDPSDTLSVLPDSLVASLVKSSSVTDLDAMTEYKPVETADDIISILKRGEIPPVLPNGQRNEGFFIFIHALKNRGLPKASVRALCETLKEVTEDVETLSESVNIDDILNRAYSVDANNPYDIARDAIDYGFYQLMAWGSKLSYIMVNANPYIPSKNIHDESSMKTLFARHAREVVINDKKKLVNPVEIMVRILPDANKVDTIGFRPGAGDVYTNSEDSNGKIYLNTYQQPFIPAQPDVIDNAIYDDFCLLVSRIFGPKDSEEYQLGMDFVAWMIQYPENKIVIAPYIMSEVRGVGKSLFFNILAKIFGTDKMGDKQAHMVKIEEITGRFFNPAGRLLNLLDEVQFPVHKDMRRESSTFWRHLKNLVTSETVSVEFKGGNTFQMPNTAAYILAGNTGSNFPMEEYDRRIWLINNNPPPLEKGTIDRLFTLSKGLMPSDEARRLIHSLRYHLKRHPIQLDLSTIRAPMSELKREMMLNSMTNEDEWFHTHFEDAENILAKFPVISKSALIYLLETSDTISKSRWQNDAEGLFREYKRKSFIRPIRAKNNFSLSRQFSNLMVVNSMGDVYNPGIKEVLYTTRDHGTLDMLDSDEIIRMFIQNLQTIKQYKERAANLRKAGGTNISAENLTNMS